MHSQTIPYKHISIYNNFYLIYYKEVELDREGDGNDAILRQFCVDVKKVHTVWLVKEGDICVYSKHKGMEMTPSECRSTEEN